MAIFIDLVKHILKIKTGQIGLALLIAVILMGIVAPIVAPKANDLRLSARLRSPSWVHPFGTDSFGRDILGRVLHGARLSILTGGSISLFSTVGGLLGGALSAYFPTFGLFFMRFVDALMAFPVIILALFITAIMGHASLTNVIIALSIAYSPRMARLVFGLTLRIREFEYIQSARSIGATSGRIIIYHIVPNLISPVVVQATLICGFAILGASALDFLGVGVPPYIPSWGAMVGEGRNYITIAPWMTVFPGAAIFSLVMALNLLGDALRDALDPRLKKLL